MQPIKKYFTIKGWKQDWEQTKLDFGVLVKRVRDKLTNAEARARFNAHKQAALDILVRVLARRALFVGTPKPARNRHLRIGRPYSVPYPDIYEMSPAQPLETELCDANSLYR